MDFFFVGVGFVVEVFVGCVFDGDGLSEDSGDGFGGVVGEVVVDKIGVLVMDFWVCLVEINFVDVEFVFFWVVVVGSCVVGCFWSCGSWRCFGWERWGSGCGRFYFGVFVVFFSFDEFFLFDDKFGCVVSDFFIWVFVEFFDEDICFCCLNEVKKLKLVKDYYRIRCWDVRVLWFFVWVCIW